MSRLIFFFLISICCTSVSVQAQGDLRSYKKDSILYLENRKLSVGFDLRKGGAITFLTGQGFSGNMINTHDDSRYIQQTYSVGRRVDRSSEGQHPQQNPSQWLVHQAGDIYGNGSKVIESYYDEFSRFAYIKTEPNLWGMKNMPSGAVLEQWFTVLGNIIRVKNKITVHAIDEMYYPLRRSHQKLPSINLIGYYNKFKTYSGEKPWTGDRITPYRGYFYGKTGKGWHKLNVTENWAAYVDADNYGLAVYSPDLVTYGVKTEFNFIRGQRGVSKTTDGKDNDNPFASFMAPFGGMELSPGDVREYQYYLIIGPLKKIRRAVYYLHDGLLPQYGQRQKEKVEEQSSEEVDLNQAKE